MLIFAIWVCPGFKILEEDMAGEYGNIVIDRYLDYSFYIMTKRSAEIEFLCDML